MITIREIGFERKCSSSTMLLSALGQPTGRPLIYFAEKWLLVNPASPVDCLNLYREEGNTIVLMYEETASSLAEAAVYLLVEMGGNQTKLN